MSSAIKIVESIGRTQIGEALNIKLGAVSAAAVSGSFPSSWYPTIQRLAEEKGVEVPDHLFNWRCPEDVRSERTEGLSE